MKRSGIYRGILGGILSILFYMTSCDDIFETDVREKEVLLLTPADSLILLSDDTVPVVEHEIDFSWEPLEGASRYHLQVVSGSFDAAVNLKEDTLLTKPQFKLLLPPGKYAWRVRAENSGYKSMYSIRIFEVGL